MYYVTLNDIYLRYATHVIGPFTDSAAAQEWANENDWWLQHDQNFKVAKLSSPESLSRTRAARPRSFNPDDTTGDTR